MEEIGARMNSPARYLAWLLLILPLLVGGCGVPTLTAPQPVTIRIAGSTETTPVLSSLTAEFSRQNPHVSFSLRGGGSKLGESWVKNQQVDLAASTLLYEDDQLAPELLRVPFALDAIAVIVHSTNPITHITTAQLHDLYSGHILDWASVGGEAGEVLLVSREDGSGTRHLFEERTVGDDRVALTAVVMPTSHDVVEYVASHPQAIGYVSQAYTNLNRAADGENSTDNHSVKVLQVDGALPAFAAIQNHHYLYMRPLFLLRRVENRGWTQQFIDFVLSPAGQAIVEQYHVRLR